MKIQTDYLEPQSISKQSTHEEQVQNERTKPPLNAEEVWLRRSSKIIRSASPSDYVVYLQEFNLDVEPKDDPNSFSQAMSGEHSTLWLNTMKEEMKSMKEKKKLRKKETAQKLKNFPGQNLCFGKLMRS
jgi:hypothetical protein